MTERACEVCNRHFVSQDELDRHFQSEHMNTEKKFECTICGKKLANRKTLAQHRRSHRNTLKSRLTCEYCPKTFSTKGLWNSRNITAILKNIALLFLNHWFRARSEIRRLRGQIENEKKSEHDFYKLFLANYNAHLKRMHPAECQLPITVHQCGECNRIFPRATDLRTHQKRHLNIREHKCTFCEQSFVTKSSLQVHLRRHNGEKPYKCTECSAEFVDSCGLKRHIDNIHSELRWVLVDFKKKILESKMEVRRLRKNIPL